jgi:hypothetical protein
METSWKNFRVIQDNAVTGSDIPVKVGEMIVEEPFTLS